MRDLAAYRPDGTCLGNVASLPMWALDELESGLTAGVISVGSDTNAASVRERITIERTIRSLGYEAGWAS